MATDDNEFGQKLQEYYNSIKAEWEESNPTVDDTPEEIARKSRLLVINNMPRLIERATLLALGAGSESVSLSAVKFLYNIIVPPATKAPGEVDPLEKLLNELSANDKRQQQEHEK